MDSSFYNVDMLQFGLAQFYSQAIQKQTFKSCQVPRSIKKKKKGVKVIGIPMQSTANCIKRKKKKKKAITSLFMVRDLAIGKSIIMWGMFSCYFFSLNWI